MKQFGVRLNTCLLVGLFVILFILNTKEARAASGLSFACGSANGQPGAQVLIPIQANQFANINSFQFSLHWSQNDAAYVGVEQFGLAGLAGGNFGTTMTNNGTVTISWDDPNGASVSVADGTILFMLRLQLIGNLGSLSSIFIDSNPTPLEAADGNLQVVPASVSAGQLVIGQPNTPPVLAAIGNKTINEGALLSFRAAATDSDSPAQTLSFSLDAGAPVGAGIDPGTGVFTWTPTEAQGPSVNSVTIRVTDSGLPARSATQTLNITVNEVNTAPVLAAIGNK